MPPSLQEEVEESLSHPPYIFTGISFLTSCALLALSLAFLPRTTSPAEATTAVLGIVASILTLLTYSLIMGVYIYSRLTRTHEPVFNGGGPGENKPPGTFFDTEDESGGGGPRSKRPSFSFLFYPSVPILAKLAVLDILWIVVLGLSGSLGASPTSVNGYVSGLACISGLGAALLAIIVGWGTWKMMKVRRRQASRERSRAAPEAQRRRSESSDDVVWGG